MKTKLKKMLALVMTCFILMSVAVPSFAVCDSTEKIETTVNLRKLVAHRGYSGKYPQNTIPAFEKAVEAGFWGMECDIHTTKDGKWVVIHDDEISNLTNGSGYVKDLTFAEIQNIRMDSGNGIENYGTLPIPTLEEYLDVCLTGDIVPVIEIKSCDTKYLPTLKSALDEYGLSEKAVIISFNRGYLTSYKALDENAEIFYLAHEPNRDNIDFCIENGFAMNYNWQNTAKCFFDLMYARIKKVPIAVWTVDNVFLEFILRIIGAEVVTTNSITP